MSRGDSTAAFLSTLAADLLTVRDEVRTVTTIVTRAVASIADAEHAALTVRVSPRRRRRLETLGSTDPVLVQADALQDELGEGPYLEALGDAEWVRSGDVAVDPRWPEWGPAVGRLGVRSLLVVRLVWAGEPIGALTLTSEQVGRFVDPDTVDLALLFAVHAANAFSVARQLSGLETAMSSRHTIGMAQGILMERYDLDEHQAFAFLTRRSSQENVKLRALAADLVTHRADYDRATADDADDADEADELEA